MYGYPKHIATKQDFLNLLAMGGFKSHVLTDLKAIYELDDDMVMRVVSGSEETEDLVTEEIENPLPLWKQKGFESRQEVTDLILANGGEI